MRRLNGPAFTLAVLAALALAFRFGLDPVTTLRYAILSGGLDSAAMIVEAPGLIAIILIAVGVQAGVRHAQENRWRPAWVAVAIALIGGTALKYGGQWLALKWLLG